jgi:hypothetical protein
MKVGPWIKDGHCWMRVLEGQDPAVIKNRVAFIEKTPRVRLRSRQYSPEINEYSCAATDKDAWLFRHKCDPETVGQVWCDAMLMLLGYELEPSANLRVDRYTLQDLG